MKVTLSRKDLSRLSASTRTEILTYLGSQVSGETSPVDPHDTEYDGFDMVDVAELTYNQMRTWMEAASDWTKNGLRVFAEQGPIVHVDALMAGLSKDGRSDNYSHFQSRTTIRTRTVTGNREAYLLGWDDWETGEGRYAVTRQTYQSLRRYFRIVGGETS